MREGSNPPRNIEKKVTYHDPCYLGRHNGIYDEPREVLKKIPGLELTRCLRNGKTVSAAAWAEAGSGRKRAKEERFSNLRLEQAIGAGAQVLVTSCPYCITALEDSRLVMNYG